MSNVLCPFVVSDGHVRFLGDHTWPAGLLAIFERARTKCATFEKWCYGLYNKLLNYCFGGLLHFLCCSPGPSWGWHSRHCRIIRLVDTKGKPVIIVEVGDGSWAEKAELRCRADKKCRIGSPRTCSNFPMLRFFCELRFSLMLEECPIPHLWGLSLLGTKMRVYCGDKASYVVAPEAVARPEPSKCLLPPGFLVGRWDLDILSREGFEKVKEVVGDIFARVENT
ncbi:hypothetical protein P691DRAFT_664751 [Macrolepiota fuliginosa MF-IS2]|uniref:Uncharacterized protein n=1 Tax=Macrolepiota fuliginosa MF-IS2 TaxID=1400762 RepID=A0A9P6C6V2_9AGAR|nr:hypothetical protein P691DRAFT_664751 [Macrolepiota fuliginosa MF-IS2]